MFGGLSEFWKSIFLSPPSTIPKSGMTGFWNLPTHLETLRFFLHILSGAFGYSLNWVHFNSLLAQLATAVNRNMRLDNCLAGMQDISAGKRDVPQKSRRVRGNHNNEIGQYYMPINQRARVAPK